MSENSENIIPFPNDPAEKGPKTLTELIQGDTNLHGQMRALVLVRMHETKTKIKRSQSRLDHMMSSFLESLRAICDDVDMGHIEDTDDVLALIDFFIENDHFDIPDEAASDEDVQMQSEAS